MAYHHRGIPEGALAIDLHMVCARTSLCRSTVYELIKRGDFPRPAKIGRRSVWMLAEVDAWLAKVFSTRNYP